MKQKETDLIPNLIIITFFALFMGGPGYFFYSSYQIYNTQNLKLITENDISNSKKGDVITGLLILEKQKGLKMGDKLASQFVIPNIRKYRKYNLMTPVEIELFGNVKRLRLEAFPDRFDYGPESKLYRTLVDVSQLENATGFGGHNNIGRIIKYENSKNGFLKIEYLVIYDSISDNKTRIDDTISVSTEPSDDYYPTCTYSFDTMDFANSKSIFSNRLYEIGLAVGDTIVGEFKIADENSTIITPHKIYCYGNPYLMWEVFFRNNKFAFVVCSILILLPILLIINMIRHKIKKFSK